MKIPMAAGVISVYGSQEEARRAERNTSVHNRQVHVINEDEGSEAAVAEEQRAEAQMRQSMKGAQAERNTSVHNRQVHVINEDEGSEAAVAEEQRAEAQMRQSMKGAQAERNTSVHNRQVHVINEDEGSEAAVAEEQRAEAQMRQSMKGAEAERMKAVDVTKTVPLCADVPSRTVMIGTEVSTEDEGKLLQFLHNNQDVFAWSKSDLTGVHESVIEHALNTDPNVKPKPQRQRPMSGDRVKSAEAEVQKLLDARIIREVQYPVWVANVVMVPKKNGNMHMCIDFTELNKACPKDPYPLPRIDVIIDQAAGCDMLSLLDCFSGYHQVWMRREDKA
jgi:hypothetical protein